MERTMGGGHNYETIPLVRGSPSNSQSSSSSGGSIQSPPGAVSIRALIHILIFQALIFIVNHAVRENVVLYCTDVLLYQEGNAPKMIEVYDAVSPALPVFGGLLADTLCKRYSVIVSGAFITLFGVLLLCINVIPFEHGVIGSGFSNEAMRAMFIIGFTFIFIGLAAYEANVGPFSARQVEARGQNTVRTSFHLLYVSQIIGILFALPIIDWVSRKFNFGFAYGILCIAMVFAIIVLMSLCKHYIMVLPDKFAFLQVLHIIYEGFTRRKEPVEEDKNAGSFLDHAKETLGGQFEDQRVEEVKHLLKTLPAFHTVTIYSIIIYFMKQTYQQQSLRLNHEIRAGAEDVPNITFEVYTQGCILVFTPFLWWLYHLLEKCGCRVTPLRRIGFGIVFAGLSILSAGFVELYRKQMMPTGAPIINVFANQSYNSSELSALAQFPQLTFGGLAEGLVRIAGLEFAYFEAQDNLKGFVMGLYILMSGVGSYILAKILVGIVNAASNDLWYPDDINEGSLEYFYFLLVGVSILDMLYLYAVSKNYEYRGWGTSIDLARSTSHVNGMHQPTPASTRDLRNSVDSLASVSGSEVGDTHDKDS